MDKDEAERLFRAIQRRHVDWIEAEAVNFNRLTNLYEVKCRYKPEHGRATQATDTWPTIWIRSPRQWIDLLSKHRNDFELP